jgi:hypothetical protein
LQVLRGFPAFREPGEERRADRLVRRADDGAQAGVVVLELALVAGVEASAQRDEGEHEEQHGGGRRDDAADEQRLMIGGGGTGRTASAGPGTRRPGRGLAASGLRIVLVEEGHVE